jgi:hypothetical protein
MYNRIQNYIESVIMQGYTYLIFALVTAALTLYFMLLMRLKPSANPKLSAFTEKQTDTQKLKTITSTNASTRPKADNNPTHETKEKQCPHYVGYLTTLPKGEPFPKECFGCRKVIRCMRIQPASVIESFYIPAAESEGKAQ